jgi:hypothetical protein
MLRCAKIWIARRRDAPEFLTPFPPADRASAGLCSARAARRVPARGALEMLKERRRGGGSRGASTHRVHDGASLLRSPVPDLGLGHSSEDEAEGWADDEEVSA